MSATEFIEPAFPCLEVDDTGNVVRQNFGLTVRDYFAAKAMQAGMTGATLPSLVEGTPITACDEPGCWRSYCVGYPTRDGYRMACEEHIKEGSHGF